MINGLQYTDPTLSGAQLGTTGTGLMQTMMAPLGTVQGTGALQAPNVTVGPAIGSESGVGQQQNSPFFSKDGGAGLILGGVQVLGNLWNTYQQNKLAKQQLSFAKDTFETNLANQTQTYNTALEDRIRARHHTEGKSSADTESYLDEHSL